ncbi:MAG: helix-turn-helix domain-containing protein [Clostridia bacterium]|nr:helix-turn-helix domain-containing protein [Clostridia bacterium]MBQ2256532.1 helix-turn-helix domain-containing protein [Clostridia bacterium]
MIKIGEKIKTLRKQKNISQEVFAGYLGVSFQAVSKWENGLTMPDVALIPAIASFFGVSTDELFDFNLFETEKQVDAICQESWIYRSTDPAKAERILREGLQRYPGNDIILNNLLYTLDYKTRAEEVIALCKTLIASTKDDSVKYDACRILATCYKENGQDDLIAPTLELIPEIYFSKLELMASLLDGDESYEAAQKHKNICDEDLVDMLLIAGKRLQERGENEKAASQFKIAQKVVDAFKDDFLEDRWFCATVYESLQKQRKQLCELQNG